MQYTECAGQFMGAYGWC